MSFVPDYQAGEWGSFVRDGDPHDMLHPLAGYGYPHLLNATSEAQAMALTMDFLNFSPGALSQVRAPMLRPICAYIRPWFREPPDLGSDPHAWLDMHPTQPAAYELKLHGLAEPDSNGQLLRLAHHPTSPITPRKTP